MEGRRPALRFLLVSPTSPLWRARAAGRPRGARSHRFSMLTSLYVAASMPPGTRTRLVDEDVEPVDFDFPADLVGLSLMTYNAPRAYEIADDFRRRGRTVVMGGYHPTFLPDEAAAHADAVCVGEAEGTLSALARDFEAGRLQPRYVAGPVDLGGLPVPDRSSCAARPTSPPTRCRRPAAARTRAASARSAPSPAGASGRVPWTR